MVLGYFRIRKILPSEFKTQPAASKEEARQRAIWLYRTCLRHAPEIQSIYPLDIPISQIRQRMREEFEKNRFVDNLDTINVLLMKGQMELEETLYMWKTRGHVEHMFSKESHEIVKENEKKSWMSGFLDGK